MSEALPHHHTVAGRAEVAAALGVSVDQLDKWRRRGLRGVPFPGPRWQVSGQPAWDLANVAAWRHTVRARGAALVPGEK